MASIPLKGLFLPGGLVARIAQLLVVAPIFVQSLRNNSEGGDIDGRAVVQATISSALPLILVGWATTILGPVLFPRPRKAQQAGAIVGGGMYLYTVTRTEDVTADTYQTAAYYGLATAAVTNNITQPLYSAKNAIETVKYLTSGRGVMDGYKKAKEGHSSALEELNSLEIPANSRY